MAIGYCMDIQYPIAMSDTVTCAEEVYASLRRASQLCTHITGYPEASAELSRSDWSIGALIVLEVQVSGVGEMRLLGPAFRAVCSYCERVSSRDAEEEPRWFQHGLFG